MFYDEFGKPLDLKYAKLVRSKLFGLKYLMFDVTVRITSALAFTCGIDSRAYGPIISRKFSIKKYSVYKN